MTPTGSSPTGSAPDDHDALDSQPMLQRYQAGDRAAGDALIRRYEDRLRRYVRILLGAELRASLDSSDVVQEVFVDAMPRLADFEYRGKGSIYAYLKAAARNRVRYEARRPRLPRADLDPDKDPFWLGIEPGSEGSVCDDLARRELDAILDEAASRLPEREREVVVLRHHFGASWEEVQAEMRFPTREAAYAAFQRARLRWLELAGPRLRAWRGDG